MIVSDVGGILEMMTIHVMAPRQARAARAVLGLSVRELAYESGVSSSSIRRIESGRATLDRSARLQAYFVKQGIEFTVHASRQCVCWQAER